MLNEQGSGHRAAAAGLVLLGCREDNRALLVS
jgi:hypothetical protein